MNILITGGSGFIGRNLVEGLKNKYKIFAPPHKKLNLLNYSKVQQYIQENKIKTVIHCAIQGGEKVLENTLRMYFSIYRTLEKIDKFIHIGSGAEYDKARHLKKVKETDFGKFVPQGGYGFAKYICGQISKSEKKTITLRLFGLYGKHEGYKNRFISNSIVKNLLGLPITIRQNVIFDYLYIDDFVKIVDFFLSHKNNYSDYNITPTKSISLLEIVKIINSISKKMSKVKVLNKGLYFQYTGSNSRLLKEFLGLKFTPYKEGIKKLYEYYLSNIEMLDRDVIMQDDYLYRKNII